MTVVDTAQQSASELVKRATGAASSVQSAVSSSLVSSITSSAETAITGALGTSVKDIFGKLTGSKAAADAVAAVGSANLGQVTSFAPKGMSLIQKIQSN